MALAQAQQAGEVVIPGPYVNIYGETIKIDPKTINPDTDVMRF
jgi:hypothetical protein